MTWELTRRRFVRAVNSKFIYGRLVRANSAKKQEQIPLLRDMFYHGFLLASCDLLAVAEFTDLHLAASLCLSLFLFQLSKTLI
jgi:hypothetical protein